jgi:RNA polymerase sigma factor (TIGR02999 family)
MEHRLPVVGIMSEITLVLQAVGRGESEASEDLFPLVYQELRRLAAARMAQEAAGQTLQPTALVHEGWLRLVSTGERNWENRAHFFRTAAKAMRCILIDNARRKATMRHGGGQRHLNIDDFDIPADSPEDKILAINEALIRLEAEDPEKARIVSLKFFGGLSNEEVAENLGLSLRTVSRLWISAKVKLFRWIREQE